MGLESVILKKIDAKLTPPSIDFLDLESPESKIQRSPETTGYYSQLGRKSPLVKIGNARIPPTDIISMSVYYDEFIPTIHISLIDTVGTFTSVSFPRKNPLLTIYVAKSHPKLSSLSQTFLITDINSIPLEGSMIRYDLTGELYVPNINGNVIRSYPNMTSQDAIQKIARDLGLGYASNEESFSDNMTWINPNLNYKTFIQLIASHAYKNESSFFECFINRYYQICLVNVENQLKPFESDKDIPKGYAATSPEQLELSRTNLTPEEIDLDTEVPIVLSNGSNLGVGSDFRILEYSMIGENGAILKTSGFRKRIQLYQHGEADALKKWYVEPLSTASPDGKAIHQTPELEDYTREENGIVKWMGTDYGNSHPNYKFAKLQNHHNCKETEKHLLRVKLDGINHNIDRGSRVAVDIYSTRLKKANDDAFNDELNSNDSQRDPNVVSGETAAAQIKDEYLSGAYYVKSVQYHYNALGEDSQKFSTVMLLSRRSWLPEPKMENKPIA